MAGWPTRLKLWERDPRCRFCKRPTVLVTAIKWRPDLKRFTAGGQQPDDAATIEHTVSRLHPMRGETQRLVLACYRCNQERNNREQAGLPIKELWRRSGFLKHEHFDEATVARLRDLARELEVGEGVTPNEARRRLGRPEKTG